LTSQTTSGKIADRANGAARRNAGAPTGGQVIDATQLQQVIETVLNGIIGAPGNNAALQAIVNQQIQQAVLNQNQGQE